MERQKTCRSAPHPPTSQGGRLSLPTSSESGQGQPRRTLMNNKDLSERGICFEVYGPRQRRNFRAAQFLCKAGVQE